MRIEDLSDYLRLRRLGENPWEGLRLRKRSGGEQGLHVRFRDGRRLELRGGSRDFHIFHRIFLRDEYRLDACSPGSLDCVVDLGDHVGLFACPPAPLARRVICYEATARNFKRLERNVAGLENVVAVREAVSGLGGPCASTGP